MIILYILIYLDNLYTPCKLYTPDFFDFSVDFLSLLEPSESEELGFMKIAGLSKACCPDFHGFTNLRNKMFSLFWVVAFTNHLDFMHQRSISPSNIVHVLGDG